MSHSEVPPAETASTLLRRSLAQDRLGHAYLFTGDDLAELEEAATLLAQSLNCSAPRARSPRGVGLEGCGACSACRRIRERQHPDIVWVHPARKTRQIGVDQMREVIHAISLKAMEAPYKLGIIEAADRLNESAANAFLKTLEEPPKNSVLILLSGEPQRLLDTILSRCLRLNFGGTAASFVPAASTWLGELSAACAAGGAGLMPRYRLLGSLLTALAQRKEEIEKALEAASPLGRYPDADAEQKERWETELSASIEAEYRRSRGDFLAAVHWWLRDIWLLTVPGGGGLLRFPEWAEASRTVAARLNPTRAQENLEAWERTQRLLFTNVQEALALEVGLLRLRL